MHCNNVNDDPVSGKRKAGCVVMVANCPIIQQSKLQSETALSTTEIETIAHICGKLFLDIYGINVMDKVIEFSVGDTSVQFLINKENSGTIFQAKILPPQFTSQNKHYHKKTI